VGPYEVESLLGAGGMGEVYRARDTRLNRNVAIKLLSPARVADKERERRFLHEARAASALNHPHIVTIHDVLTDAGTDFLIMEYVPGKPLGHVIGVKGLNITEALHYAIQIADALAAAHAAGIIHRDLKPGNVMIAGAEGGKTGSVKLLDFGLAKLTECAPDAEPAATRSLTDASAASAEGVIAGTVSYMSPEQAQGKKVDARCDIFSFGAVLYEVITGRRAFRGDSQLDTLSAILRDEPKPVSQFVPDLPRELDRIVKRCLRKDPARRFQSMTEIKLALEDLKMDLDSGALAPVAAVRKQSRGPLLWLSALALLGAGIAGWLLLSSRRAPASVTAVPLTSYPGSERYPTFSPDGNQVAFSWNGDKQDNFDIYVKLIGAGSPLRLTTDPAEDFSPAWSPDGRSIAFLRRLPEGKVAVMLISALGGPERVLTEVRDVTPAMWESSNSLSWSPDGRYLAILDKPSPSDPVALFLLSVDTGDKLRLTQPPSKATGDNGPAFSPDGRMLAFTRSLGFVVNDIYVIGLSSTLTPQREPRRLTFDNRRSYSPAWLPHGREIVFCSNRAGMNSLWRIEVKGGKTPQRLESVGEDGFYPAIARQGHRLAYTRSWSDANIWRVELPEVHSRAIPAALKSSLFIASTRTDGDAIFSPDGKKIAFWSERSGFYEIWISDSSGLNPVQLTSLGADSGSPRWSPDGKQIAFDSNQAGHWEVYVTNASGARPRRLTNGTVDSARPSWSRDGSWIYFGSIRAGDNQIWKMPSAGGDAIQVTTKGGFFAAESSDGKFLYYTKTDGVSGLWRAPISGGEETQVLEGVNRRAFAVRQDGIYFFGPGPSGRTLLRFLSLASPRPITLGTIEKPVNMYLDVSPDGRRLLYSQIDHQVENLMLVENFR
jgi:Tol biopolymer transport system component